MNLLVRALMNQVGEVAKEKGFTDARVLYKVNKHGELVVAILIPPRTVGEWAEAPVQTREEKKESRDRR
jgi:hypothetical protein